MHVSPVSPNSPNSSRTPALCLLIRCCELINEALHAPRGHNGQSLLATWLFHLWGRLLLKHIHEGKTHWQSKWAGFLRHMGISPESYDQVRAGKPNSTTCIYSCKATIRLVEYMCSFELCLTHNASKRVP